MHFSNFHYLPLTPGFFPSGRVVRRFAGAASGIPCATACLFRSLGISSSTAMLLLFGSLIGSYFTFRSPSCRTNGSCPTR